MGWFKEEVEMKGMLRRKSRAGHGIVWAGGCEEIPSSRHLARVWRPGSALGGRVLGVLGQVGTGMGFKGNRSQHPIHEGKPPTSNLSLANSGRGLQPAASPLPAACPPW